MNVLTNTPGTADACPLNAVMLGMTWYRCPSRDG